MEYYKEGYNNEEDTISSGFVKPSFCLFQFGWIRGTNERSKENGN
jgi:hypothetical protein